MGKFGVGKLSAHSNYEENCLNDKPMEGSDLLRGLIGTLFRLREGTLAFAADVDLMFLQV